MNDSLIDDLQDELESSLDDEREPEGDPEPKPKAAAVDADEFRRVQKEAREARERTERLERELQETRQAQEFWKQNAQPKPEPIQDPENWLEEIEAKGAAAFEGRFATPEQVQQEVAKAVARVNASKTQEEFAKEFPDLLDKDSEFFKQTDELLGTKYAAFAKVPETRIEALRLAATEVKQRQERQTRTREGRAGAAGAYRPMSGGGSGAGSRGTALTPMQRMMAREFGVPEKNMLASVNEIENGRRR